MERIAVSELNFNEKSYLNSNPDVADAVRRKFVSSGAGPF